MRREFRVLVEWKSSHPENRSRLCRYPPSTTSPSSIWSQNNPTDSSSDRILLNVTSRIFLSYEDVYKWLWVVTKWGHMLDNSFRPWSREIYFIVLSPLWILANRAFCGSVWRVSLCFSCNKQRVLYTKLQLYRNAYDRHTVQYTTHYVLCKLIVYCFV